MSARSIAITGAGSGIGRAATHLHLARGWHVFALDRDAAALKSLAAELPGASIEAVPLDVTDEAGIDAFAAHAAAAQAPLRALVNSAGLGSAARFADTTPELMRRLYEVNVVGAFALSKALAPVLEANGGGSIVQIASVSGIKGNLGRAAYGASKGALITLTKVMAVELAPGAIRVNAIAPGPIETPMVAQHHSAEQRAEWHRTVPLRRYGTPEEIAEAIAFLCDEERASYVTGQVLSVDGGFTAAGLMA
ncbi:SDR family NAD(P)-dependent oxidoreductase [Antarcticirhabdus aurantiaca]|uniref:SDR family NAD(P)-dependent oxidoreductase n=1 Tax=Antarcticirhabdus aurantiaca TaxID=2606717 RepID=A0ACD4NST6_9HYPH|nr:SDR family oxidoreductase [Antarcticirhabdus aurantiaca]WAJ29910.1 SDR family NAD(P)-dependent oxidoreductase [Jeongeuplla avenae]